MNVLKVILFLFTRLPSQELFFRRDVSGYSDTVFERPRSTHFELDDSNGLIKVSFYA